MLLRSLFRRRLAFPAAALVLLAGLVLVSSTAASAFSLRNAYDQHNLVADVPGVAPRVDPNLVNPWGIAYGPLTAFWLADNDKSVSTLYLGGGLPIPLVVRIPPHAGSPADASARPTGIVYNGSRDFKLDDSHAAQFIFASEDGTISGWSPAVDLTHSVIKADKSASGAVYKGLAIGSNSSGRFLYAANFAAGRIDVFDKDFAPATLAGNFTDPGLPACGAGPCFAPFNVQALAGKLYVAYALQDAGKEDEVAGAGNGFVSVFDMDGKFIRRLASQGRLNAPWGLTLAPLSFGRFAGDLLVGNFGDGRINAYDPRSGAFMGTLEDEDGDPIVIDGLWALSFGNGIFAGDRDKLYFTAGPDDEQHGLFGFLSVSDDRR